MIIKSRILEVLSWYQYNSITDWVTSLLPSIKYEITTISVVLSTFTGLIASLIGMEWMAFLAFLIVMFLELISGIWASMVKGEPFQKDKLFRFIFKAFCYIAIMSATFLFADNYRTQEKDFVAGIFDWLHIFLVVQIVLENIYSIIENIGVIQGKPKGELIEAIKSKMKTFFE